MRKLFYITVIFLLTLCLCGCNVRNDSAQIVTTTLPVYEFTTMLCKGTGLTVGQLVTESVSCLHDYSLQVRQMRMIEQADMIVISGAGLEDFLDDALTLAPVIIDASVNAHIHESSEDHGDDDHNHAHEHDPHIWLSPENAKHMAESICSGLAQQYPVYTKTFENNLSQLIGKLDALEQYGTETLKSLTCRELITFHDGFSYLAESFDLTILYAIEEESGSEASAAELIDLIELIQHNQLSAVFTEKNGSVSAANIIAAETGVSVCTLDMAISGDSYFAAMYQNIDTIKEALT